MADMPRPRPPYLHRKVTRHGKVIWAVRKGKHGRNIRIRGEYGSPEFEAAYQAAVAGSPSVPPKQPQTTRGTLEWLWLLYRQADAWTALEAATRKQRENIMVHVLKSAGAQPLSSITKSAILDGIARRNATPFQAKHFLSTMRGLFTWARDNDLISDNPTDGVKVKKPKTEGFPVWAEEDIEKCEARWPIGTRERVMLDVFLYTGLRRGDAAVVCVCVADVRGGRCRHAAVAQFRQCHAVARRIQQADGTRGQAAEEIRRRAASLLHQACRREAAR